MIPTCYMLNIVMKETIKKCKFKQPIQGMLKWTEQQLDKSISLKSNHSQ